MLPFCGLPTFHHTCKLKRIPFYKIRYQLKKHRIFAFSWFYWFPTEWLETLKKTLNLLNLFNRFDIDWICMDLFSTMFHPSTSSSLWLFGPVATSFFNGLRTESINLAAAWLPEIGTTRMVLEGSWFYKITFFCVSGNFMVGTSSKLKLCSYSSLFDPDHWP